jgi:hypothetical protein
LLTSGCTQSCSRDPRISILGEYDVCFSSFTACAIWLCVREVKMIAGTDADGASDVAARSPSACEWRGGVNEGAE